MMTMDELKKHNAADEFYFLDPKTGRSVLLQSMKTSVSPFGKKTITFSPDPPIKSKFVWQEFSTYDGKEYRAVATSIFTFFLHDDKGKWSCRVEYGTITKNIALSLGNMQSAIDAAENWLSDRTAEQAKIFVGDD